MHLALAACLLATLLLATPTHAQETDTLWLDALDVKALSEGIPAVVARRNQRGDTLRIAGQPFTNGIGFAATAVMPLQLDAKALRLVARIGMDDASDTACRCRFLVIADKKVVFESPPTRTGQPAIPLDIDLRGVRRLGLLVLPGSGTAQACYADWADARLTLQHGARPRPVPNDAPRHILTPPDPPQPRIRTPAVFGARPGHPVLLTVAATGERPMRFHARGLPPGLSLDTASGIITGTVNRKGSFPLTLEAVNPLGRDSRTLTLRIGDTIALTPPMGWNGWNSWSRDIDRDKVMASARAMVASGLRDHGWTYVNIDDAWQGPRQGPAMPLQPNDRFPRFREMADSIHALGLKLGIYSTPWIASYAGFPGGSTDTPDGSFPDSVRNDKRRYRRIGTYRYEDIDARQFAAWGVDYLKYDWRIDLSSAERMSSALRRSGRDIVYSLSNSAPFAQAADWKRIANLWRTGPDIRDSWHALYLTVFALDRWAPYNGPGHWNDPDMMVLGQVTTGSPMHPTRLTPDEQYAEVSMFALLSAPMLIGCPIDRLDAFTRSLLTNAEVIAIDQDPLGTPAKPQARANGVETWVKPLHDGGQAIGLFHTADYGLTPQSHIRWDDEPAADVVLDTRALGIPDGAILRDAWRQLDIGTAPGRFRFRIPHHGVVLLRTLTGQAK
jgi:alpha-galactosidase